MFDLYADKNKLSLRQKELTTSGSLNVYNARFEFSPDWDGLDKVAVFRAGGETVSVLLPGSGECSIPWEVLDRPQAPLYAGVYGTKGEDVILPTQWVYLGTVLEGAVPGEAVQPPTPDVYQQILAQTSQNRQEATEAADKAEYAAERAEDATVNPPKLSERDTWLVWDFGQGGYVDTGLSAIGPPGIQGEPGSSPTSTPIVLSASEWVDGKQTVSVAGVSADEASQLIQPVPTAANQSVYYEAGIRCTGQTKGSLTFTALTMPAEDLAMYVVIQEVTV